MALKESCLKRNVSRLLSIEFGDSGAVTCTDSLIRAVISKINFAPNFGNILQQIQRVIDECYPDRNEDLFIQIEDEAGLFKML
jgi:hypothetical protein